MCFTVLITTFRFDNDFSVCSDHLAVLETISDLATAIWIVYRTGHIFRHIFRGHIFRGHWSRTLPLGGIMPCGTQTEKLIVAVKKYSSRFLTTEDTEHHEASGCFNSERSGGGRGKS